MAAAKATPTTPQLPDGWQRVQLGNVADFQQGGTPAKAIDSFLLDMP